MQALAGAVIIKGSIRRQLLEFKTGLPGAAQVSNAKWIEVKQLQNPSALPSAQQRHSLGSGEMSTILLASELSASIVLLDDYKARKFAKTEGLKTLGSVGLLEAFYARGYLTDLRACFRQLISHSVYIDQRLLDRRLRALGLPPLQPAFMKTLTPNSKRVQYVLHPPGPLWSGSEADPKVGFSVLSPVGIH